MYKTIGIICVFVLLVGIASGDVKITVSSQKKNKTETESVCSDIQKLISNNLTMARAAELRGDLKTAKQLRDNVKSVKTGLKDIDCED